MPRRLIARLFRRLDASSLPYTERLDLEAELMLLLRTILTVESAPHSDVPTSHVVIVDADAQGDIDTVVPS